MRKTSFWGSRLNAKGKQRKASADNLFTFYLLYGRRSDDAPTIRGNSVVDRDEVVAISDGKTRTLGAAKTVDLTRRLPPVPVVLSSEYGKSASPA